MRRDLTVITCVRDGAAFVGGALRSVIDGVDPERLLEILVIDDGSTDGSARIAAAVGGPVRVVRTLPRGLGPARNTALDEARGALIGWLDADDEWAAPRPDPRLAALDADPSVDLVRGRELMIVGAPGGPLQPIADPYHSCAMAATIARREVFDRVRFDETNLLLDDVDWHMRAVDAGVRIANVEAVVQRYRQRADSLSRDGTLTSRTLNALHAGIVRRRSAP